jgi:hypothetical protein
MEIKYNNQAGRILAVINFALSQDENRNTSEVWASVFSDGIDKEGDKISPNNFPELYYRLAQLNESLAEVEETTRRLLPDDVHLYNKDFSKLKLAFAPKSLDKNFSTIKPLLTEAGIMAVELCAKALPKEADVTKEELAAILESVHALRKQVLGSAELSKVVKEWILELLAAVARSVELYSLRGNRKLKAALASLVGEIYLHSQATQELKAKHPTIYERFMGIANSLFVIAQRGKQMETLIEYSAKAGELIGLAISSL